MSFPYFAIPGSKTRITAGKGSPNGVVTGTTGDLYLRQDGSADAAFYTKTTSTGANGWQVFSGLNPNVTTVTTSGDITTTGGNLVGGLVAATQAVQNIAGSGAVTLTAGKSTYLVAGNGGAVTGVTVPNGTVNGTLLTLIGTDNTNTVTLSVNGATNIAAANGVTTRVLGKYDILQLIWITDSWCERGFQNNL